MTRWAEEESDSGWGVFPKYLERFGARGPVNPSSADSGYSSGVVGLFGLVGVVGELTAPLAGRFADRRSPRWKSIRLVLGSRGNLRSPLPEFGNQAVDILQRAVPEVGVILLHYGGG